MTLHWKAEEALKRIEANRRERAERYAVLRIADALERIARSLESVDRTWTGPR